MKKKSDNSSFTPSTYLVGIGASAGGLEAINSFFERRNARATRLHLPPAS